LTKGATSSWYPTVVVIRLCPLRPNVQKERKEPAIVWRVFIGSNSTWSDQFLKPIFSRSASSADICCPIRDSSSLKLVTAGAAETRPSLGWRTVTAPWPSRSPKSTCSMS
jgi:hypothetical protein